MGTTYEWEVSPKVISLRRSEPAERHSYSGPRNWRDKTWHFDKRDKPENPERSWDRKSITDYTVSGHPSLPGYDDLRAGHSLPQRR